MHYEVGIRIGALEFFTEIQRREKLSREGIHQDQPLGIDSIRM